MNSEQIAYNWIMIEAKGMLFGLSLLKRLCSVYFSLKVSVASVERMQERDEWREKEREKVCVVRLECGIFKHRHVFNLVNSYPYSTSYSVFSPNGHFHFISWRCLGSKCSVAHIDCTLNKNLLERTWRLLHLNRNEGNGMCCYMSRQRETALFGVMVLLFRFL